MIQEYDEELAGFTTDASRFINAFEAPISQSVPHIYLSALPFAPTGSKVSKKFLHEFPHTLTIQHGKASEWAAMINVFDGHTDDVTSVAFSPDGIRIVSSSADETIRVWDAQTGHSVLDPLRGHTDYVRSVAFSPDGKRIVSGSQDKTI